MAVRAVGEMVCYFVPYVNWGSVMNAAQYILSELPCGTQLLWCNLVVCTHVSNTNGTHQAEKNSF